jgi:neutral ceramidase
VHDDLHARALVLDDGVTEVALVSVEVIAVSAEFTARVRSEVERATGIPTGNVFLSATHTHCGPVTLHHFFNQSQPLDEAYLQVLGAGIVAAVRSAKRAKRNRRLRTGLVPCSGVAVNRRTADGLPVDPYAGVLLVLEEDGRPAVVAVLYACHTTVMGPDTLSLTQDFPFYTLAKLRSALGLGVETIFFNGAEGDLSIGHKSDLSAVGIIDPYRTFATAQRLGEILADAVLDGMASLTVEPARVSVRSQQLALELKQYAPVADMTQRREDALAAIGAQSGTELIAAKQRYLFARIEEYYARLYEAAAGPEPKRLTAELSVIQLGETSLVTLPGEVFVRIALNIRSASPFMKTMFLGLTNDYIGYVPDRFATATAGYEVIASRVPWNAGVEMEQATLDMLHALQNVSVEMPR